MSRVDAHDTGAAGAEPQLGVGSASVSRTDDGRYIIVDGRRWRASDPTIPQSFERELVAELMAARRAVRAAGGDAAATQAARKRVGDAKVALGERGEPWWEEASDEALDGRIRAATRALLRARGSGKSVCPSDVARIVASPDWRPLMDRVRAVGAAMAADGEIVISVGDQSVVDPISAGGPIRFRAGPDWDAD